MITWAQSTDTNVPQMSCVRYQLSLATVSTMFHLHSLSSDYWLSCFIPKTKIMIHHWWIMDYGVSEYFGGFSQSPSDHTGRCPIWPHWIVLHLMSNLKFFLFRYLMHLNIFLILPHHNQHSFGLFGHGHNSTQPPHLLVKISVNFKHPFQIRDHVFL